MEIFFDAPGEDSSVRVQKWMADNEHGYVVNQKGKSAKLHRSGCSSFDFSKVSYMANLTTNRKYCSNDKQELLETVRSKGLADISSCKRCNPQVTRTDS